MTNNAKWTAKNVGGILTNPIYAFGIWMDDSIIDWVQVFNRTIDKEFWSRSQELQEGLYRKFFNWLITQGYVELLGEAETIIGIDKWLLAQEKIQREPLLMNDDYKKKTEAIKTFLHSSN